ncbi:5199_t:CDS:2 [Dentiscutata erythropus]|uniref:5199_t:CDS:1 n=1 Tax=Dentiscutata erythropus TaxID=1348616 RepID=A0A9N9JUR3_9GLOM|nr:5199_t:CDS:2 [Dentiscutata erythropus]
MKVSVAVSHEGIRNRYFLQNQQPPKNYMTNEFLVMKASVAVTKEFVTDSFSRTSRPSPKNYMTNEFDYEPRHEGFGGFSRHEGFCGCYEGIRN